jgi:hypothetical protein
LRSCFPRLAELLDDAEAEVLAYLAFPAEHWRKFWSNNPLDDRPNDPITDRRTFAIMKRALTSAGPPFARRLRCNRLGEGHHPLRRPHRASIGRHADYRLMKPKR